ncbi:DinB family protein [Bacillus carboniphilus]|uniref:DinB family protein n=1 Tax=Bacillus carboniphilus TaxID=86663 RepID=A0ABP3GEV7_9BACI
MLDFRVTAKEGYDRKIGELVSMLEYTRAVTLEEISSFTLSELDFIAYEGANTIGGLLQHINFIEFVHQLISFEDRDMNEQEQVEWGAAWELGDRAREEIRGNIIEYYLDNLAKTREKTLRLLQSKTDDWLFEENKWDNGVSYNHYWLWYHVMEDEISHRGQIRVLKRMIENHKITL